MQSTVVFVIAVAVAVVAGLMLCRSRSGFKFTNANYQYSNASPPREKMYYECITRECGGRTDDQECLDMCQIQSYRADMGAGDVKDLVCQPYIGDKRVYYRCLNQLYGDYRYP